MWVVPPQSTEKYLSHRKQTIFSLTLNVYVENHQQILICFYNLRHTSPYDQVIQKQPSRGVL